MFTKRKKVDENFLFAFSRVNQHIFTCYSAELERSFIDRHVNTHKILQVRLFIELVCTVEDKKVCGRKSESDLLTDKRCKKASKHIQFPHVFILQVN